MTNHPSDEFDEVPERSMRQGVHRGRLIPARSGGLALTITVAVLALLLLAAIVFLLPRLGMTADDGTTEAVSYSGAVVELR